MDPAHQQVGDAVRAQEARRLAHQVARDRIAVEPAVAVRVRAVRRDDKGWIAHDQVKHLALNSGEAVADADVNVFDAVQQRVEPREGGRARITSVATTCCACWAAQTAW